MSKVILGIVRGAIVVIGMLLLLYMMGETHYEIQRAAQRMSGIIWPLIKMSLWGFLFGVLMEWKGLFRLLSGRIKVSWLIFPSVVLMALVFIPRLYWLEWFGLRDRFFEIWSLSETHMLLSVLSGVLLIRSLSSNS